MKRLIAPLIIGVLAFVCLMLLDKSCNSDAKLEKAKADYAELKRITEADHQMSLDRITTLEAEGEGLRVASEKLNGVIVARNAEIATLRGKVTTSDAEAKRLRTEVQPVIDANPALREFVASLDAGIVLRDNVINEQEKQIATLTAQGILKDQRFAVQVKLTDEWKDQYEQERQLRGLADDLNKSLVRAGKKANLFGRVSTAGLVAVGALVVINSLTK